MLVDAFSKAVEASSTDVNAALRDLRQTGTFDALRFFEEDDIRQIRPQIDTLTTTILDHERRGNSGGAYGLVMLAPYLNLRCFDLSDASDRDMLNLTLGARMGDQKQIPPLDLTPLVEAIRPSIRDFDPRAVAELASLIGERAADTPTKQAAFKAVLTIGEYPYTNSSISPEWLYPLIAGIQSEDGAKYLLDEWTKSRNEIAGREIFQTDRTPVCGPVKLDVLRFTTSSPELRPALGWYIQSLAIPGFSAAIEPIFNAVNSVFREGRKGTDPSDVLLSAIRSLNAIEGNGNTSELTSQRLLELFGTLWPTTEGNPTGVDPTRYLEPLAQRDDPAIRKFLEEIVGMPQVTVIATLALAKSHSIQTEDIRQKALTALKHARDHDRVQADRALYCIGEPDGLEQHMKSVGHPNGGDFDVIALGETNRSLSFLSGLIDDENVRLTDMATVQAMGFVGGTRRQNCDVDMTSQL